jgi:hypothetical protein
MLDRWTWPKDDADGIKRLSADLSERGVSFFHMPEAVGVLGPEPFVERVLGQRPRKVLTTLIKPQPDEKKTTPLQRRAFPMNTGPAGLHVDSPTGEPVPPQLQIMICKRAASEGGENQIVDVWGLLDTIEAEEPDLYREIFESPRTVSISGKSNHGPMLALRYGHLVLLHGASVEPGGDPVGQRFVRWVKREPPIEFRAERGDVYINNNHRTLHGRRGFTDTTREFLRFLVWPTVPLLAPTRLLQRAARA